MDDTRHAASLQLYDALWEGMFNMAEHVWKEKAVCDYLKRLYFQKESISSLQKYVKGITSSTFDRSFAWYSSHWYGVLGTLPRVGSGTLTLEARHSQWEMEVRRSVGYKVFKMLPKMQEMYNDSWQKVFSWGEACSFDHFPTSYDEGLLNGGTLRTNGRSPAVDFWQQRGKGNYQQIMRQTGKYDECDLGQTTFYVMRKETVGKEAAARACIEADLAKSVVDLISQEGKSLQRTLAALGIITRAEGTGHIMVNVDRVRNCVVRD